MLTAAQFDARFGARSERPPNIPDASRRPDVEEAMAAYQDRLERTGELPGMTPTCSLARSTAGRFGD